MVLIHGYGGSSLLFYRILKDLARHFHVYMIDLLGMGRYVRLRPMLTIRAGLRAGHSELTFPARR